MYLLAIGTAVTGNANVSDKMEKLNTHDFRCLHQCAEHGDKQDVLKLAMGR